MRNHSKRIERAIVSTAFGCGLVVMSGCTTLLTSPLQLTGAVPSIESKLALARLCDKHSDKERASKLYTEVLDRDPENQFARRRLAVLAVEEDNLQHAEQLFLEALEYGKDDPRLHNDYGYLLFLQNRLDEAESEYRTALNLDPKLPEAWSNLGLLFGERRRFEEARSAFKHAAASPADVCCNMGFVFAQANEFESARREFESALAADPDCKEAAQGLLDVSRHLLGQEPVTVASTSAVIKPNSARDEIITEPEIDLLSPQPPASGTRHIADRPAAANGK